MRSVQGRRREAHGRPKGDLVDGTVPYRIEAHLFMFVLFSVNRNFRGKLVVFRKYLV